MPTTRITVRNVAGMPHSGGYNPYRTQAIQAASWRALVATGADIIVAPESSGVNAPFAPPPGWRARPYSALSREGGSVIAVADHIDADLGWRPDHPVLEAFTCYLDFAVVRAWDADVALAATTPGSPSPSPPDGGVRAVAAVAPVGAARTSERGKTQVRDTVQI